MKFSKIYVYPESYHGLFSGKNSIDYNPAGLEDIEQFSELLFDKLELRSLDMTGSIEEMQQLIIKSIFLQKNSTWWSHWIQ